MRINTCGVVIVNWNGWSDTIECLEAVFRMKTFSGPVVICDNGSTDNSVEMISSWSKGNLCSFPESRDTIIRNLVIIWILVTCFLMIISKFNNCHSPQPIN